MVPSGYLATDAINRLLGYMPTIYPDFCQMFTLPEKSVEGRSIHGVRLGNGAGHRKGILFVGGLHARELVNPDALIYFTFTLGNAYHNGTGATLGGKTFPAEAIQNIIERMDVFVIPLVNPDGRVFVQDPNGDAWWRKNRRVNSGSGCMGVDINRNFDFLWSSNIGTSSNPCSEVYKGASPFSEPETRNIRYMLDKNPNIVTLVDVHSYSQFIMYPWGDDESQTSDPNMNFHNPAFNGQRGTTGDTYREYIDTHDQAFLTTVSNSVRDAIAAVSGTAYQVKQQINLYPTSGTSDDYAISRYYADHTRPRVFGFAVETGLEFQPLPPTNVKIYKEVSAGMIQFCIWGMCAVEEVAKGTSLERSLDDLRVFRDQQLLRTPAGRRYARLLMENTPELLALVASQPALLSEAQALLHEVTQIIAPGKGVRTRVVPPHLVHSADALAQKVAKLSSPRLLDAIQNIREDMHGFEGRTVREGLRQARAGRRKPAAGSRETNIT